MLLLLIGILLLETGCASPLQDFLDVVFSEEQQESSSSTSSAPVAKKKITLTDTIRRILADPLMDEQYQDLVYEGETLFRNNADWYFFYSQLNEQEQEIYDTLLMLTRDPTSTEYRKGIRTEENPTGEVFQYQIARAYQALLFDHPELFWLRKESGLFSYYYPGKRDRKNRFLVMFVLTEPYVNYEEEMTTFNEAVDAFLSEIDITMPAPELALAIYDRLMQQVSFDHELAEQDIDVIEDQIDYGFTAYGALVENSRGEPHRAVCDGYSYAYTYLLQQVGIPAIRISGKVGNDLENMAPHSWNLLQLDGEWYEADATWDDEELEYDPDDPNNAIFFEAAADPYYWGRIRHHLFLLTTEEMSCFIPTDEDTYYSDYGYASFLHTSYHVRDTQEEAEQPGSGDHLSYLAPIATGTKYRWETLVREEEMAQALP